MINKMATCWFCYKDTDGKQYHTHCCEHFFGMAEVPELLLDQQILQQLGENTIHQQIAVTGVQPKLSVALENISPAVRLLGDYILKPQHPSYHMMPENEDLTMHIAALFHIPVCKHTLLRATDGSMVYLTKRQDRDNGRKIHMEDCCQLSGYLTENKYKGSYEKTGKLITKYCTDKAIDLLNYFELVLFSYLTGNNDMHLKNFSVIHLDLAIALCPAYDLLNVNLVNPGDQEDLALTLNAKKKKLKLTDFIKLADSLNISETAKENTFRKFMSLNSSVESLIEASFLDQEGKDKYKLTWCEKQYIFHR